MSTMRRMVTILAVIFNVLLLDSAGFTGMVKIAPQNASILTGGNPPLCPGYRRASRPWSWEEWEEWSL